MSQLIFLNPYVLGASSVLHLPSSDHPYHSKACKAFVDLMERVEDASIVLLGSKNDYLEIFKEAWEREGLFGNRIIDIIGSRGCTLAPTDSVHHYLWQSHPSKVDSFVIVDRMDREDSYPDSLFVVKERLKSGDVESIIKILHAPLGASGILNKSSSARHECVCS